jgi:hypothetical protein
MNRECTASALASSRNPAQFSRVRELARARRSLRALSFLIGNRSLPISHQNYPQSAKVFCQQHGEPSKIEATMGVQEQTFQTAVQRQEWYDL